ncbi:hypothetical protein M3196_18625 [Fictibacillus nanhaiensis]|uniref:hypothetical protein n=1 Tax=Fictibacillus nanhaiensis TaxID=742169 RepID=UPI0020412236|nr:hypothetical protein [Fictibacillus nanhaiensis]MCM3733669.1 hypothetical protein [Fictibacillus nanhaiensis]
MYNHPYNHHHHDSYDEPLYVDRPNGEDEEDGPFGPPPQQLIQQSQIPQPFFTSSFQPPQLRARLCACLGNWGLLGLRRQGQFGRDFWFFPTVIRRNSVTGFIWIRGRRQRVRYEYSQIRNFICFG